MTHTAQRFFHFLLCLLLCLAAAALCSNTAAGSAPLHLWRRHTADTLVPADAMTQIETATNDEVAADADLSLSVNTLLQNPELPNGCEATAMATVLQYEGFSVSPLAFARDWLPCGAIQRADGVCYVPSPEDAYVGDPASTDDGWYCFEGALVAGANAYLEAQGSPLRAEALTGADEQTLRRCLADGWPVIVWTTIDRSTPRRSTATTWVLPDGTTCAPYVNLHCVVLTGVTDDICSFADPMYGDSELPADQFWSLYEQMGRHAVAVR